MSMDQDKRLQSLWLRAVPSAAGKVWEGVSGLPYGDLCAMARAANLKVNPRTGYMLVSALRNWAANPTPHDDDGA